MAGCGLFVAEHGLIKHHFTQQHFRVVDKIGVHGNAVFVLLYGQPRTAFLVRHNLTFPLFQKKNVCGDLGSGNLFERIVRQADCTNQLGFSGNKTAHTGICLIHRKL
ncbi:hypothetical protein SDC9_71624 [bioreactor metagenome]|uniref:Uncharacterized protein n=1 Tax=bioreactor metagenome TaxID=1076179 RepID=A0A644YGA1_9ZZZZ